MPNFESFKQYGELEKQRKQELNEPDPEPARAKKPSIFAKLRGKTEPKP